jgi:tetratricopeptide (TPR) repeat protein
MRSSTLILLVSILCAAISACSNMGVRERAAAPAGAVAAVGAAQETPALPPVELSGELLYQILEAEIALQRRYYDIAGSLYLELTEATRDPRFAELATRIAIFSRDDTRALRSASLWAEIDPALIEAHQMVVVASIRAGDLDTALQHLEFLLEQQEGTEDGGLKLVASLLNREQDVTTAMQLLERFIAKNGENGVVYFYYAQFAVRVGQLPKAEEAVDRSLALQPGRVDAIALRVRVLQLQKRDEEALNYLAESVRKFPDDTRISLMYARMLVDTKRLDEAVVQYEKLLDRIRPNTDILLTLGMINLQLNRLNEAEKYLVQVMQNGGNTNDAQFYLGWLEEGRNNIEAAIGHYAAVAGGNLYLEANLRVVALRAGQGQLDEARGLLSNLRTQLPDQQRRLYQVEGEILRGSAHNEEAMQVISKALELFPGDFALLYLRAMTAESLGQIEVLEQDLHAILERDPSNVDALNSLGYTLADRTNRYEEARGYIESALALSPQNNAILDSMGWVLYRLGDYKEALQYLRRSLEIKQDHEVAAHLGEVLWVSGEREEAINVWEQALELFPADKLLLDVMKRFGQ